MERINLSTCNEELKEQLNNIKGQWETSEANYEICKKSLEDVMTEYAAYKEKAKSILKQKDDMMRSLNGQRNGNDSFPNPENGHEEYPKAELMSLK